MTADTDLMRAEGLEKMARAICVARGMNPNDSVTRNLIRIMGNTATIDSFYAPQWEDYIDDATAALAAWEAHLAETEKAPDD